MVRVAIKAATYIRDTAVEAIGRNLLPDIRVTRHTELVLRGLYGLVALAAFRDFSVRAYTAKGLAPGPLRC